MRNALCPSGCACGFADGVSGSLAGFLWRTIAVSLFGEYEPRLRPMFAVVKRHGGDFDA